MKRAHFLAPLATLAVVACQDAAAPKIPDSAIDFETYPDGSASCTSCPVTTEFTSRGVVFTFASSDVALTNAQLFMSSSVYDEAGGPPNHSVTSAGAPGGGFYSGVVSLHFSNVPKQVTFRLRGNDLIPLYPVDVMDETGGASGVVERTNVRTFTIANGYCCFREEVVTVSNSTSGIARIDFTMSDFIVLIDNMLIRY